MEIEKCDNFENSSKVIEVDDASITQSDDEIESDNTGIGRTYECSYCKRGFTNAQALGGHMNIHRKDKAKAKQQHQQQQHQHQQPLSFFKSPQISYNRSCDNNEGFPTYGSTSLARQRSHYGANDFYQSYYSPFASSLSSQPSIYGTGDFTSGRSRLFGMYEEHLNLGADLSLRMSSSMSVSRTFHHQENKADQDNCGAATIDLELRLGYDP